MALNKSFCAGFVAGFGTSELIRKIFKAVGQTVNDMTDTNVNNETNDAAEAETETSTTPEEAPEQEATTEPAAQEETTEVPVEETPKKNKKK